MNKQPLTWALTLLVFFWIPLNSAPAVKVGADLLFTPENREKIRGVRLGLVTNQTGVDSSLKSTLENLLASPREFRLVTLFSPEHGLEGENYAAAPVEHSYKHSLKVFSLHGKQTRPSTEMLKGLDLIIYDIQEIGTRSYTYATTLYYMMEECAKKNIRLLILDRPNPINGITVDGALVDPGLRSFVSYINVPYCHGMTIGELARFFNAEYKIGCSLDVIAMKGWKREMSYAETGLAWIPPSPQIPEQDTPLFYPITGLLGELGLLDIGVFYTLPFKIIGAPWIDSFLLAETLNRESPPGVHFTPFHYKPFTGLYKNKTCHGVKILITDKKKFKPVSTAYQILGAIKILYPEIVQKKLETLPTHKKQSFAKACGSSEILNIILTKRNISSTLLLHHQKERELFQKKRKKYLLYNS